MSTAVLNGLYFDFDQIERKIQNLPREASNSELNLKNNCEVSSKFVVLTRAIKNLANSVSKDWSRFKPEEQEILKSLAYTLINPSKKRLTFQRLSTKLQLYFQFFVLKLRGEEDVLVSLVDAIDELVDNILDAIEQEDAAYQQVVINTLEEIKTDSELLVKPEDTREWLRSISSGKNEEV